MSTLTVLIAQVESPPPPAPGLIAVLVPWLLCGLIMGPVMATIAKRKGKSRLLWFFLAFIPIAGVFLAFILASRPDIALLDRIQRLEDHVAATAPNVRPPI
jgi:hypothetical protein